MTTTPGATARRHPHLILLLAALSALAPLCTDLYLPVMPAMARDLGVTQSAAQATVAAVLIGVAIGQLVIGSLSDAWGRRRPAVAGASMFVLAAVGSALAPGIASLVVIRFVAGIATAACLVTARAIVADVYPDREAARSYATLAATVTIVPVLAPAVGGVLALFMGWRMMFVLLAGAGFLVLVTALRSLEETLPERRPAHVGRAMGDLAGLLRLRLFGAYVACVAAAGGVLFSYIAASSFLLQVRFGMSATSYGFVFALNASGLFVAANVSRRLVQRTGPAPLLSAGQLLTLVGVAVVAAGVAASALPLVLLGLLLTVSSMGLIISNAMALAMAHARGRAGSAAGLFGIAQFAFGGLVAPLAGAGGSAWSFVLLVAGCALAGPLLRVVLVRGPGTVAESAAQP